MPDSNSPSLTDRVKRYTDRFVNPLGAALDRLGISPDAVTWFGLLVVGIASVIIALGQLQLGGVVLFIGLVFDAVDGAVARARGGGSDFGAVLDSTLDRYADGFIFAALGYYFAVQNREVWLLISLAALVGSISVSYVRARADGVGVAAKTGWFTRFERSVIVVVMLLIPSLLTWGVALLALGTHWTVIQRLRFVQITLNKKGD